MFEYDCIIFEPAKRLQYQLLEQDKVETFAIIFTRRHVEKTLVSTSKYS